MSAQMAAATGDMKWVARYDKSAPRVRPKIDALCDVAEDHTIREEEVLASFSDDKLTTIENEAIKLIREKKRDVAAAMLQSQGHEDQKVAYSRAVQAFTTEAHRILQAQRAELSWKILMTLASIGIILPGTVMVWLVVMIAAGRIARHIEHRQKTSAFAREWQETFNAVTDAVCIIAGKDGNIVQCNRAMTQFLDKPYDEIIGHSCYELLHGSSKPIEKCPLQRMFETRSSETAHYRQGDRWFKIKVDPLFDHSGRLLGGVHILSDITEYQKATMAVRDSENKFRLAFENAQDAILWIEGETGVIIHCNNSAEALLGEDRLDIVGRHHADLYPAEKIELYSRIVSQYDSEPNSNVEAEIVRPGGDIRTVTVAVSTMVVGGKKIIQAILRDVTHRKMAVDQIRSLAKFPSEDPNPVLRVSTDGKILYANEASSSVLSTWKIHGDQHLPEPWDGRVTEAYHAHNRATYELDCDDGHTYFMTLQSVAGSGYVNVYGLDITRRKEAERARMALELQLGQKQKMEAIGTLAGGIAHDFNNILSAIQGYAELSLDDLSPDHPVRDNLEQMMSCINRATKLVKQILTFSRKDQQEQERTVILVVDDEEMMVDVTRKTLEKLGHVVVTKTNSIDALELFQEDPETFGLVITDQVMPNMLGTELARQLISIKPDIPVILCSGFPEKICTEELKDMGIKAFLTKPISRRQISEIIQKVLEEKQVGQCKM